MQKIVHSKEYKYIHPIFTEFEKLYTALSNNDEANDVQLFQSEDIYNSMLRPFEDIFNEYGNCEKYLKYSDKDYRPLSKIKSHKKNVIVAFSGGKDSTAVALYYKNKGYNVYLYHVHGLNRFFPYELQSAEKVANYLELPLIVENVNLRGISLYPDHPLKNIIIANMALQWGITNGVGAFISVGDYETAHLEDVCFETAGDDCVEMWDIYKPIMEKYIPKFHFEIPLINVGDTLEKLEKDKELLKLTQSCVMTHRFKNYHNKRIQEKFKVKLMPNRCGTCWKCALEYIYYTEKGVLEYNPAYYKHCMKVLQNTVKAETGKRCNFNELWENYFFYMPEKSKYWL